MCFPGHRRSLAEGCSVAAQRVEGAWRNYGFSLPELVSEEQLSKQWVQALSSTWVSTWVLALPSGLHTASWAEEWAGSVTTGRRTGAHYTCHLSVGKDTQRKGVAGASLSVSAFGLATQREGLCPTKLSGKFLIAKSHMQPRATLFLPKTLPACYFNPLFFHQAV